MVIISLVIAGVAITLDKLEKRQAAKAEQENRNQGSYFPPHRFTEVNIDFILEEQSLVSAEATRKRREEEAFIELQNYADFQDFLSTKVLDGLETESIAPPGYEPSFLPNQDLKAQYLLPSICTSDEIPSQFSKARLPCPIIIPQETSDSGSRSWSRAYTPSLMECGIHQASFLNFVDSFNEFVKTSPYLDAINIASLSSDNGWQDSFLGLSTVIFTAIQQAKFAHAEMRNNTFLDRVNTSLFSPHGLFALIVLFYPSKQAPILTIEFNPGLFAQVHGAGISPPSEQSVPSLAMIYPALRPTPPMIKKSSKLRKMGNFIADYSDGRFQASQHHQHPFSSFLSNSPNSTSFHSLVTSMSVYNAQGPSRTHRKIDSQRLRPRLDAHSSASRSTSISSRVSTPSGRTNTQTADTDSMDGVDSMTRNINNAGMTDGKPGGGIGGGHGGLQPGVLYLVIVNDPDYGGGNGDHEGPGHTDAMDLWMHDAKGRGRDTKLNF